MLSLWFKSNLSCLSELNCVHITFFKYLTLYLSSYTLQKKKVSCTRKPMLLNPFSLMNALVNVDIEPLIFEE